LDRKTGFWVGFLIITFVYSFPLAIAIILESILMLTIILVGFLFSIYLLYRLTIKHIKPKYPVLPPEGKPDIYTAARIPRPIYEDMEQYPWLFEKKHEKVKHMMKKVKKKH